MNRSAELVELFTRLVEATPIGYVPYVTLTTDPERPYGALIIGPGRQLLAMVNGPTVSTTVTLLQSQLARGQA